MEDEEDNPRTTKPCSQDAYNIVAGYSEYSSLAGLIFVFMPNLPCVGRVFKDQTLVDQYSQNVLCKVVLVFVTLSLKMLALLNIKYLFKVAVRTCIKTIENCSNK
jgi:hypothetical protein